MRSNIKSKHHDFHTNKNDNKTNKKHRHAVTGHGMLDCIWVFDEESLGDRSGWMGYITVMDQTDAHWWKPRLQYI